MKKERKDQNKLQKRKTFKKLDEMKNVHVVQEKSLNIVTEVSILNFFKSI